MSESADQDPAARPMRTPDPDGCSCTGSPPATDDAISDRPRCEPVVSVQLATAGDLVAGHLAYGVLLNPTLVVVPGPLTWLLDGAAPRLDMVLAHLGDCGEPRVETRRPKHIDVLGLASNPGGAIAVIHLDQPSDFVASPRSTDVRDLRAQLSEDQSDVWSALEMAGAVPRWPRQLPPAHVVLPAVEAFVRTQRQELLSVQLGRPGDVAIQWCKIVRACSSVCEWWVG